MKARNENLGIIEGALLEGLRPDVVVDLATWATANMESPMFEGGRWDPSRTPYAIEPMRCLSLDDPTPLVVTMAGTQTFKTAVGVAWLAYTVAYGAGPFIHARPTKEGAREFIQERVNPVFEIPALKGKVAPLVNRHAVPRYREFKGGFFFGCGTNSAADASGKTARFYWQDETDRESASAGGEGPMSKLLPKRVDRYGARAKGLQSSSPTTKDGPIIGFWALSSQAEFMVPCPRCGHMHVLMWPRVRWAGDPFGDQELFDVWMECPECGGRIDQWEKTAMMAAGRWDHRYPNRPIKGFHLCSLYSPVGWRSWKTLVQAFVEANEALKEGRPWPMQVFVNTDLAEPWEYVGQAEVPVNKLMVRREAWPEDRIPAGVLLATAGVDVQDDRLEVHVKGWGRNLERWTLDYAVIEGGIMPDADGLYDWDHLDDILDRVYQTADGRTIPISLTCVDLLGHRTNAAFTYTRRKSPSKVIGIMGKYGDRPVVERRARKDEKRAGARYRLVGTDSATSDVYASLRQNRPGPNYWHFPIRTWLDESWFNQLTAEHAVHEKDKRGVDSVIWVQHQKRNEVLDTAKYAYAALKILEIEGRLHDLLTEIVPQRKRNTVKADGRHVNVQEVLADNRNSEAEDPDVEEPDEPATAVPVPDRPCRPDYGGRYGGSYNPRAD